MMRCRKRGAIQPHRPAPLKTYFKAARLIGAPQDDWKRNRMALRHLRLSRRSLAIAAALLGTVSLALGAPSVLNKRAPEAAKAVDLAQATTPKPASRLALVIGNGKYPDANAPLTQPINDARAIGAALRREGFDVDLVENASRDAIDRAVDRLTARINAQSVVLLFFGGYGIQAGRESFMIPVDAAIWKESDVRSQGVSIEAVLAAIK